MQVSRDLGKPGALCIPDLVADGSEGGWGWAIVADRKGLVEVLSDIVQP